MNPITQIIVSTTPTATFTIPPGLPAAGRVLRVRVNGNDVGFARTGPTAVVLRVAAPPRAIVDIFEVTEGGNQGGTWTGNLDFPLIAPDTAVVLTVAIPEAALGDIVSVGLPANNPLGILYYGFVSAAGVVSIRAYNVTAAAIDPPVGAFRVGVSKN